jgi:photosystem II stability/assembly factor-like uncharacterized protein
VDNMKKVFSVLVALYISFQLNAQWVKTHEPIGGVNSLSVSGNTIFACTEFDGIYRSTDNGISWDLIGNFNELGNVFCLTVSEKNLFAGTSSGVYLSTNSGINWTSADTALIKHSVASIAVSGNNVFAGTGMRIDIDGDVFVSTNSGTSWSLASKDLDNNSISTMAISGSNLFAGTKIGYEWPGHGLFLSSNNGISWTSVNNGLTDTSIIAFAVDRTKLFAGTQFGGVFYSNNNGTNWMAANNGLPNIHISSLAARQNPLGGTYLFAGTDNFYFGTTRSGVFLSTNNGTSWSEVSESLNNASVYSLVMNDANIFAATDSGVYMRSLSEIITNVESGKQLSLKYSLGQNYPNPFNPSTVIKYSIPFESNVNISFYNSLGQTVREVNEGTRQSGNYEINFNSSGLASGIYFYSIRAVSSNGKNDFNAVKKMILLK